MHSKLGKETKIYRKYHSEDDSFCMYKVYPSCQCMRCHLAFCFLRSMNMRMVEVSISVPINFQYPLLDWIIGTVLGTEKNEHFVIFIFVRTCMSTQNWWSFHAGTFSPPLSDPKGDEENNQFLDSLILMEELKRTD